MGPQTASASHRSCSRIGRENGRVDRSTMHVLPRNPGVIPLLTNRVTQRNMPVRRQVLKQLAGIIGAQALAGVLARKGFAGRPASAAGTVTPITANLAVLSGFGGNVVALSAPEGLLVIDSGAPEHAKELLQTLSALPGGHTIRTVFNTHWHW